jgi:hypothetical protein
MGAAGLDEDTSTIQQDTCQALAVARRAFHFLPLTPSFAGSADSSPRHARAEPAGTLLASTRPSNTTVEMTMNEKNQGEGNREADRRYREGVRETVNETSAEERARRARNLTPEELEAARAAEELAKAKKRPASSEREI